MRSITEFPSFKLTQGLQAKTALSAEGKTNEEIQASIGTTFKMEGDKLKHFMNAMEVAQQNAENLSRVLVVALTEGEKAPPKALQVEETHYIPDFVSTAKPPSQAAKKSDSKSGDGKKGKGKGPKESPWGLSPEQKAAKKGGGTKGANTPKS